MKTGGEIVFGLWEGEIAMGHSADVRPSAKQKQHILFF